MDGKFIKNIKNFKKECKSKFGLTSPSS
jgi:hypothetical protein